jgi:hypothetical protein
MRVVGVGDERLTGPGPERNLLRLAARSSAEGLRLPIRMCMLTLALRWNQRPSCSRYASK